MRELKLKVLSRDPPRGLEGKLHDVLVVVSGGEVEDGEDVGTARLDVVALHVDHVGHTPHHYHHVTMSLTAALLLYSIICSKGLRNKVNFLSYF